jgi:hypothetical protein
MTDIVILYYYFFCRKNERKTLLLKEKLTHFQQREATAQDTLNEVLKVVTNQNCTAVYHPITLCKNRKKHFETFPVCMSRTHSFHNLYA